MPVDVLVICSKFARRALRGEWDAFFRHRGLVIVIWPTGQYTYQYRPTPLDDLPPVSSKKATDDAPAPDSPKSAEPLKVAPPVLQENPPTSTVSLDSRAYPSVVMPIQPQRRQAVS
jgi:hypothetical protein